MTREEMREAASVLLAALNGEQIQYLGKFEKWTDCEDVELADFNFTLFKFRIKPEPKECWINFAEDCAPSVYVSEKTAFTAATSTPFGCRPENTAIHMQEVID